MYLDVLKKIEMDLVECTNLDNDCRVHMGYIRALVTMRHPSFLTSTATTAPISLPYFSPETRGKVLKHGLWYASFLVREARGCNLEVSLFRHFK
jgi:hypothetical protein